MDGIFYGEEIMARMKDFIMDIQELVYNAVELGMRDEATIYAYVYMKEPRAIFSDVRAVLEEINRETPEDFIWS
jgi:hypothetical protein